MGTRTPPVRTVMKAFDFADMALEWLRTRNPACNIHQGGMNNTVHVRLPNPTDALEWGAKRFSHEHPLGKLVDYTQELHDNFLLPKEREFDAKKVEAVKEGPTDVLRWLKGLHFPSLKTLWE
jgi:hypothetical protein